MAIAEVHAFRGEHDAALERIARAVAEAGAAGRQEQREQMVLSPFLSGLQRDARWNSLLARIDAP
jgi:hypothetical protein